MAQLYAATNPRHYHRRNGMTHLVGHRDNPAWFGEACPAQCPGLREGESFEPMEEYHRVDPTQDPFTEGGPH